MCSAMLLSSVRHCCTQFVNKRSTMCSTMLLSHHERCSLFLFMACLALLHAVCEQEEHKVQPGGGPGGARKVP